MCVEMEDRVKKYLALCKEEIYRLLINRKIYICLLLYVLLAHPAARMVGSMFGIEKAYEAIGTIASINNFNKLLVLVAAVPFALSRYSIWIYTLYCEQEWKYSLCCSKDYYMYVDLLCYILCWISYILYVLYDS